MENFQLYRTNPLLSGQLKWDLIVKSGELNNLYLSPISPNIPYTRNLDENILKYTHQENLRNYYKQIEGSFYSEGISDEFKNKYPQVSSRVNFSDNDDFNELVKEFYYEDALDNDGNPILRREDNPIFGHLSNVEFIRNYTISGGQAYELRFVFYRGKQKYYYNVTLKQNGKNVTNEDDICVGEFKWKKDVFGDSQVEGTVIGTIYVRVNWELVTTRQSSFGPYAMYVAPQNLKLNPDAVTIKGDTPILSIPGNPTLETQARSAILSMEFIPNTLNDYTSLFQKTKFEIVGRSVDKTQDCTFGLVYDFKDKNQVSHIVYNHLTKFHIEYNNNICTIHGKWDEITGGEWESYIDGNGKEQWRFKEGTRTTTYRGIIRLKIDMSKLSEKYDDNRQCLRTNKTVEFSPSISLTNRSIINEDKIKIFDLNNSPYIKAYKEEEYPTKYNEKVHIDDYELGCRRGKYKTYGKQYEFLCPVWLEKLDLDKELKFKVELFTDHNNIEGEYLTASRVFSMGDKMKSYFYNYIKSLKLNEGNDDVLNINFDSNLTTITGVDLSTGELKNVSNNSLMNNLLYRERPLLEADSMVTNLFKENSLICTQLFNFNLCFNLEDVLNYAPDDEFVHTKLRFKVTTYIGDEALEIRDFYSNYEYLKRTNIEVPKIVENFRSGFELNYNFIYKENPVESNVLDYLQDNSNIDLINKNKILQSIFHWSLVGNNNYLFNLYGGFGGVLLDNINKSDTNGTINDIDSDDIKAIIPHLQGSGIIPNIIKNRNDIYNTNSWCNLVEIKDIQQYLDLKLGTDPKNSGDINNYSKHILSNAIQFDYGDNWYNDNHYISEPEEYIFNGYTSRERLSEGAKYLFIQYNGSYVGESWYKTLNALGVHENSRIATYNKNNHAESYIGLETKGDYKILIFDSQNKDYTNLYKFIDILDTYRQRAIDNRWNEKEYSYGYLMKLRTVLKGLQPSKKINFNKSLFLVKSESPNSKSTENKYYKDNSCDPIQKTLYRYDGKIKPTFVKDSGPRKNNIYYKKLWCDTEGIFKSYNNSGFEPLYPSLGYFSLGKEEVDYTSPGTYGAFKEDKLEYVHYNNGRVLYLKPEIKLEFEGNYNKEELEKVICQKLEDQIGFIPTCYVRELYDIDINYDYKLNSNNIEYNYNIKLTLK